MGILEGLFKDKDNSINKEIEELNKTIKEKELEIQRLKIETQTMKETYMSPKQLELLEKNLKALREENNRLKKEKISSENSAKDLSSAFSLDKFLYKLPVEDFFSTAKFSLIREFLLNAGILFVQDVENILNSPEFKKVKNYSAACKKYFAFRDNKEVTWDNRVYLCKGERVQKIFKMSRKFVNFLSDNSIEFMDDMKSFNFDELAVKGGFTQAMVYELQKITEEYFKTYKIQ